MCGIVGYIGHRDALPVLKSSLERVTYRGYDSFGIALVNGNGLEVVKKIGTVEGDHVELQDFPGSLGIGHTRWATVGGVSQANAHPHPDCGGDLAIVHNGDIDNFHVLRQRLQSEGHVFTSETDSEVIAHLIESYYVGEVDLVAATAKAIGDLEGPFAIVVLHRAARQLVVARRESPLVVGLGDGEAFIASDVPAILPYTNRVVYLEDGDLALVTEDVLTVWQEGVEVTRPQQQVTWSADQMDKQGYDHYMIKEIYEQPDAVRETLAEYLPGPEVGDGVLTSKFLPLDNPDAVLLLGCGTSYHAALLGEQILERFLDVPISARVASEFQKSPFKTERGLAVAFSQSGETSDTMTALKRVKAEGFASLGVTNVLGSSITRTVDAALYTLAGPEVAVASTKTFITQLISVYLLGYYLSPDRAAVAEIPAGLRALPGKISQVLGTEAAIKAAARLTSQAEHMFIIAKGLGVPVALEGALKFKEVAYLHTEGYPAGELKHGPFAMLDENTPVVALVPSDENRIRVITSIKEIKARGSQVIAIADQDDEEIHEYVDVVLTIPKTDPLLAPVLQTVVLQLLSYYCAEERGCPIDRPRNLAKSVTVP